jgi:hypothetical protein
MTLARLPQVVEPRKYVMRKPNKPIAIRGALVLEADASKRQGRGDGVLCSLFTVTCVWPAAVIFTAALFAVYPPLGWLFLILCAVPIWGRGIDALQRRFEIIHA